MTLYRRVPSLDEDGRFPDRYAPPSVAQAVQTVTGIAEGLPAAADAAVAAEVLAQVTPLVETATTKAGDAETARGLAVTAKSDAETARGLAQTAQGLAEDARDAAQAVPTTTDGILTALDANPASAFRVQQDARIGGLYVTKTEAGSASAPRIATTATMQAYADSNGSPQTIPTYDGSGQAVHPSVVHIPGGFGPQGFTYWMAMTPYPATNSAYENPSIIASYDGYTWAVPTGLTNPVRAKPSGAGYNSDANLIYRDGLLYLTYRTIHSADTPLTDKLYYTTSADGVTWAADILVMAVNPTVTQVLSPSLAHFGGVWHLWAVDNVGTNKLRHYTSGTTPTSGAWSAAAECAISNHTAGFEPWHTDIQRQGDEWVMFMHETSAGASSAGGFLRRSVSTDGLAWDTDPTPLLMGHWNGTYTFGMYKPTALPYTTVNGSPGYRLWYSYFNGAGGGGAWGIAHTFVRMRHRTEPATVGMLAATYPIAPYFCGDRVDRADNTVPGTMTSGMAWTVGSGSVSIASRALCTPSYGLAQVDFATSTIEVGAIIDTLPQAGYSAYILACRNGGTDYVRFGPVGTTAFAVSVRVGNVSVYSTNRSDIPPKVGDRIRLRVVGGFAYCYIGDLCIYVVPVDAITQYTPVGVEFASGSTGRLKDFYAKAL